MTETLTIEEVLALDNRAIVQFFKSRASGVDHDEYINQYNPSKHDIHDTTIRPDKIIKPDKDTITTKAVARLSIPFQKLIVDRAAAFLVGDGITLSADPQSDQEQDLVNMVKLSWHDNKMDYKTRQMVRTWMTETEVAEYWYLQPSDLHGGKWRLRCQIWAHSTGDNLYPYFDEFGDMVAFARGYRIGKVEYMDIWTADRVLKMETVEGLWSVTEDRKNDIGKIPVIYYTRTEPEWVDVQPLIDRYEKMISNFADANDYFASPMVVVKGTVTGFAEKGEQGKMITAENDADVKYLTWDQAPEAIKLEKDTLQELIFAMTQTPDISFQQMKGLGSAISGTALKMMFLDPALKALRHQEEIGEGVQRRINLMKACMAIIRPEMTNVKGMYIEPVFTFYTPRNDQETLNMLVTATGGKAVMARRTAVSANPFTINTEKELAAIKEDELGDFGNIVP